MRSHPVLAMSDSSGIRKTAPETADEPQAVVPGRPFQKGHDPRRGHGLPGRSGAKPQARREACRQALGDAKADVVLAKIISGDVLEVLGTADDGQAVVGATKNADRLGAIKLAASYAHGLPIQPTEDLTPREPAHLTAQQLIEALPRLVSVLPGDAGFKAKLLLAIETDAEIVS
jgi:hypothetical protein